MITATHRELAYKAGRMACRTGKPLTVCPYEPEEELARWFVRGYRSHGGAGSEAVSYEDDDGVDLGKAAEPGEAGGADPKAPPPDQRWPGWEQDLAIAAAAAATISAAMAAGLTTTAATSLASDFLAWSAHWRPGDPEPDVLGWLRASTDLPDRIVRELTPAIEDVWAQGFMVGWRSSDAVLANLAAGESPRAAVQVSVDWGAWEPGDPVAARKIMTDDGSIEPFRQLLRDSRVSIARIADGRLERIAVVLADGLRRGLSVDEIAKNLRTVVDDPKWAWMVAVTETNRALSAAALDSYRDADLTHSEWMTAFDQRVCKICKANEDAGPVPLGQRFPSGDYHPPGHPRCRCALVPHIDLDRLVKAWTVTGRIYISRLRPINDILTERQP